MVFYFYFGPDVLNDPPRVDEEGGADDAHVFTAGHLFELPGTVSFQDSMFRIAEQEDIQVVFFDEPGMAFDRIRTDAHDDRIFFLKC